ncbi:MAG: MucR family transcriptional regulator [Deltaproteobacteria bacterium]|nr:MucR family transcriptional regulator [Deltaproteobacteria bacterium]
MASEFLTLTAQIVMSHVSMTELTTKELVKEIKEVYRVLAALEAEVVVPETATPVARSRKTRAVKMVASPEAKAIEEEAGPVLGDPDYLEFMESREG